MTTETTLAPPKNKPWFECTNEDCNNRFQGYHGKIGCKCLSCDDLTPEHIRQTNDNRESKVSN